MPSAVRQQQHLPTTSRAEQAELCRTIDGAVHRAGTGAQRRRRRIDALLLAAVLLPAGMSRAQGSSEALFLNTLMELRRHDPAVQDVRGRVLERAGFRSGCGAVSEGDLVAFYCPIDRTIFATTATLARVEASFGVAGVRYLAAHEMAHGRQHAVGGYSRAVVRTAVLDELQADCIAGTYLNQVYGYSADSEAGTQVRQFAYSIGDRSYLHPDWHGNPSLRVAALTRGLNQGNPAACLSSNEINYGTLLERGANWLRRLRAR